MCSSSTNAPPGTGDFTETCLNPIRYYDDNKRSWQGYSHLVNDGTTGSRSQSAKIRDIRRPSQRDADSPDPATQGRKFVYPDPDLEALLHRQPADDPVESSKRPQPNSPKRPVAWQRRAEFGLLAVMLTVGAYFFMLDQRSDIDTRFGNLEAQLDEVAPAPSAIDDNAGDIRSLDQRLTLQGVRLERLETSQLKISGQLEEIADVLAERKPTLVTALAPVAINSSPVIGKSSPFAVKSSPGPAILRGASPADTISRTPRQELVPQSPAVPATGIEQSHWHINLASYDRRSMAEDWAKKPASLGHPAEIVSVRANGRQFFRIRVAGGNDKGHTRELAASLQQQLGLQGVWINRKPADSSAQP
jgi:cell division septation protein DedD